MRAAVAEGFQHFDRNLIDRAGFMQNFAKHSTQRHHHGQKAERAAHAFFHRGRDFIERHAGKKPGPDGNHHQRDKGVHARLHHQEQQKQNGPYCR